MPVKGPSRSKLIGALKKRSRVRYQIRPDPTPLIERLKAETQNASDRTLAIVYGTVVEDALRHGLSSCMDHLTPDEEVALFEQGGALSDFAAKINILYAMKLMSAKSKAELHDIREIRNAFAHALPGISFSDKEVHDVCKSLDFPRYWDTEAAISWNPRDLFITTCDYYISSFQNWGVNSRPQLSINGSFL